MKAFVLTGPSMGEIRDLPIPVPQPGQALIKVSYAGICGGDPGHFAANTMGGAPDKNIIFGHELCGTVLEINNPDNLPCRVKVGDKVTAMQSNPCGVCEQCGEGRPSVCTPVYGSKPRTNGCVCEYVVRNLDRIFKFNDDVDPRIGAIAEPLAVACFDVKHSGIKPGDTCLITGAGSVGILIGLIARLTGASRVIFAELSQKRIDLMREFGFEAYNSASDNIPQIIHDTTNGHGVDLVFEVSGAQPCYNMAFECVRYHGTVVPVGLPVPNRAIDFTKILDKQLNIVTVNSTHPDSFLDSTTVINRGVITKELDRIITSEWPIEQYIEALTESTNKAGDNIKIVIRM